jgi:hypothetical protein
MANKTPWQLVALQGGKPIVLATLSVRHSRALREARQLAVFYPGPELWLERLDGRRAQLT